jgi:hypothetical protein
LGWVQDVGLRAVIKQVVVCTVESCTNNRTLVIARRIAEPVRSRMRQSNLRKCIFYPYFKMRKAR